MLWAFREENNVCSRANSRVDTKVVKLRKWFSQVVRTIKECGDLGKETGINFGEMLHPSMVSSFGENDRVR